MRRDVDYQADGSITARRDVSQSAKRLASAIDAPPLPQPIQLGRYVLYNEIAQGGMATIYLGRMQGAVGFARTVAIKRLHAHFAKDPEFVSMFLDEARLAARIQHPNVVGTLDVVATQGELFLVMEYVQGASLSLLQWLADDTAPPIAVATAILVDALHGLHAAHEARSERGEPLQLIHRDVSPQNILVGVDGAARVLDFGVAKASNRLNATTEQGRIKGKLPYMAPEQVRGGKLTRTVDVYAAAVCYWEALAGRTLFHAENQGEIIERVLFADIEPPSKYNAEVPAEIDSIVMRSLSRDPSARHQTARELALAIERALRPALRTEVAAWVETVAREALESRAQEIAHVESFVEDPSVEDLMAELDSGQVDVPRSLSRAMANPTRAPSQPEPVSTEPLGRATKPVSLLPPSPSNVAAGPLADTMAHAALQASPLATPSTTTPDRGGRRGITVAIGLLALAALGTAGIYGARAMRSEPAAAASLGSSVSNPSIPPEGRSALTQAPSLTAAPEPPLPAASPITTPAPSTKPAAGRPTSAAATQPRPQPTANCAVPYTITADGRHVYKRECLNK